MYGVLISLAVLAQVSKIEQTVKPDHHEDSDSYVYEFYPNMNETQAWKKDAEWIEELGKQDYKFKSWISLEQRTMIHRETIKEDLKKSKK